MGQGKLGNGHFGWRFSFDSLCFSFVAFLRFYSCFPFFPEGIVAVLFFGSDIFAEKFLKGNAFSVGLFSRLYLWFVLVDENYTTCDFSYCVLSSSKAVLDKSFVHSCNQ
jgi:hypothetical protein